MAPRAPKSKKAASKAPAKTYRTRRQKRNEQLVIRNIPVLPPTFRCWFCVSEKRLREKVRHSRTLPICHNCQERYTNVASARDTGTHPAAAILIPSSPPPSSSSSSPPPPRPMYRAFPSRPLRPAVVIDSRKGLKKKMILKFKASSKKASNAPTSSNKGQERIKCVRLSSKRPDIPTGNEGRRHPRPILFLSLPMSTGQDGGKILLSFPNPL